MRLDLVEVRNPLEILFLNYGDKMSMYLVLLDPRELLLACASRPWQKGYRIASVVVVRYIHST
jgi:hypothetical protein